jgi:outer membrane protein OmpA-like peptidoglycan-associated protein
MVALTPNLAIGPDVAVLYAPQTQALSEASVLWNFGAAARLQGDRSASWSPYLEVAGAASKQSDIWNPAMASSVGIDFALEPTNTMWLGPVVTWSHTFQTHTGLADQTPLLNNHDSNVLIVGLSLSFDAPIRQKVVTNTVVVETVRTVEVPAAPLPLPPPAPPCPPAPVVEQFLLNQHIMFAFDSSKLDATAMATLDEVVRRINRHPDYSVVAEGHASSDGNVTHNLTLAKARGDAVLGYLTGHGVDGNRLSSVSMGASGVPGDASNRRTDFVVSFTVVRK